MPPLRPVPLGAGLVLTECHVTVPRHVSPGHFALARGDIEGAVSFRRAFLTLAMGFSGQVMRFDQDAYWGLGIVVSIIGRVPLIGRVCTAPSGKTSRNRSGEVDSTASPAAAPLPTSRPLKGAGHRSRKRW